MTIMLRYKNGYNSGTYFFGVTRNYLMRSMTQSIKIFLPGITISLANFRG